MKPSVSKRRGNRAEPDEFEEDAPLASASRNSTPSGSSESDNRSTKRSGVKKADESGSEYSGNEDDKKRTSDKGKSAKKRKHDGSEDGEASRSGFESDDDAEPLKSAKKGKPAKEKKPKKGKGKRGRKGKQATKDVTNGNAVVPDSTDYEVEDIMEKRMKFGKLQYLIRWKGYGSKDDTWERADGLDCPDIIKRYKQRVKTEREAESSEDEKKEEFEVSRIIEVHFRRDGSREFLVCWKGFTSKDNTWEHEANMKCPEIIAQFMRRVDQAKEVTQRELREHRKPTKHYTANSFQVLGRRLSGRSKDKPRVNYFYDDQY